MPSTRKPKIGIFGHDARTSEDQDIRTPGHPDTRTPLISPDRDRTLRWRTGALLLPLLFLWLIEAVDQILPGNPLDAWGIWPRNLDGLPGILIAPFLHRGFDHLLANTIPLLLLGSVILLRGVRQWVTLLQIVILISGVGAWLLGSPRSNHIGASGVVFGLVGFLIARGVIERTWTAALTALVTALLYGGAVGASIIPEADVSWTMHAFGFLGGIAAARWLCRPSPRHRRAGATRITLVRGDGGNDE
ncbi:MAG TPA: rhomboid family intramembrane serine protease [Thermoanaerobaculia bacterium]|nr:rhomboid family intramembrane serine protease [Thermoanaerobaculia bacterium]